jgi:hypothetical protein
MSSRMSISIKNACVIKRFKDQVNLSEPLYRITRDLPLQFNSIYAVLQNMEIFTNATFPFSRGQYCLSLFKK